jgi:hypothetical protein
MSVTIDELQMETQPAPVASGGASGAAAPKPKRDLKSELDMLRERELRLKAD